MKAWPKRFVALCHAHLLLLLAPLFILGACVDMVEGEAAPATDKTSLIYPQFDKDAGRMALPNDLVLGQMIQATLFTGDGTVKNMPIRIPFNGPISYPFDGKHVPTAEEITAWGNSVFIFPADMTNPSTQIIPALPKEWGGVPITAGKFKTVYLDSNYDLVLVPDDTTFANAQTSFDLANGPTFLSATPNPYVAVVTKGVKSGGLPIGESPAFFFAKQETSLVDGGTGASLSPLLSDAQAQELEVVRQILATPINGIVGTGLLTRNDIALLFTFSTESTDSSAGINFVRGLMESDAIVPNAAEDITWLTAAGMNTDVATPALDLTTDIATIYGVPAANLTAIGAIHKGAVPCVMYVADDGSGSGDYIFNTSFGTTGPLGACPNKNAATVTGLTDMLEFLVVIPAGTVTGTAIFQHGVTRQKEDVILVANTLASRGIATIAFDGFADGSRLFPVTLPPLPAIEYGIVRPDDPFRTTGYAIQTILDLERMVTLVKNNTELAAVTGNAGTPLYFVGNSLGAMFGTALYNSQAAANVTRYVLNVPGADAIDLLINSPVFSPDLLGPVSASTGLAIGSPEFNATMLGLELGFRHALSLGYVDPLAIQDPSVLPAGPDSLLQMMLGETYIPNNNTELLSRVMGNTDYADGDGHQTPTTGARWIFNPANYTPATANHTFLMDGATSATVAGQTQMLCFLLTGLVNDPTLVDLANPSCFIP